MRWSAINSCTLPLPLPLIWTKILQAIRPSRQSHYQSHSSERKNAVSVYNDGNTSQVKWHLIKPTVIIPELCTDINENNNHWKNCTYKRKHHVGTLQLPVSHIIKVTTDTNSVSMFSLKATRLAKFISQRDQWAFSHANPVSAPPSHQVICNSLPASNQTSTNTESFSRLLKPCSYLFKLCLSKFIYLLTF